MLAWTRQLGLLVQMLLEQVDFGSHRVTVASASGPERGLQVVGSRRRDNFLTIQNLVNVDLLHSDT